jgi:hypothetical protein
MLKAAIWIATEMLELGTIEPSQSLPKLNHKALL